MNLFRNLFRTKEFNPLVRQTLLVRFRRWQCERRGCLENTWPDGYGWSLPQAFCRRCGHVTGYGSEGLPLWILPWGEFATAETHEEDRRSRDDDRRVIEEENRRQLMLLEEQADNSAESNILGY